MIGKDVEALKSRQSPEAGLGYHPVCEAGQAVRVEEMR